MSYIKVNIRVNIKVNFSVISKVGGKANPETKSRIGLVVSQADPDSQSPGSRPPTQPNSGRGGSRSKNPCTQVFSPNGPFIVTIIIISCERAARRSERIIIIITIIIIIITTLRP